VNENSEYGGDFKGDVHIVLVAEGTDDTSGAM